MKEAEFTAFLARNIPEYAASKVRAGNWIPAEAVEKSRLEHEKLLPRGLATPNQHLYTIEQAGVPVGTLWLEVEPGSNGNSGFVYDLYVDAACRRRGIGGQAMLLLEQEAARLSVRTLGLHVFGDNAVARAMYEKLGYAITNISMSKRIALSK